MIGLILIATGGPRYTQFLSPLMSSIWRYLPESECVLFGDDAKPGINTYRSCGIETENHTWHTVYQPDLGWPRATLMRYHAINQQADLLRKFSHVFYMDIDMLVENPIAASEICSDGITAVIHPGYPDSFERNPLSTAYVPFGHVYYQGCFVGGQTNAFLEMTKRLAANIDTDDRNGIMALWHDESHLNCYLEDNLPDIALSPEYAFPAPHYLKTPERWLNGRTLNGFVPKIRHLEKTDQGSWKNAKR